MFTDFLQRAHIASYARSAAKKKTMRTLQFEIAAEM